jgi:hypothetical protein
MTIHNFKKDLDYIILNGNANIVEKEKQIQESFFAVLIWKYWIKLLHKIKNVIS